MKIDKNIRVMLINFFRSFEIQDPLARLRGIADSMMGYRPPPTFYQFIQHFLEKEEGIILKEKFKSVHEICENGGVDDIRLMINFGLRYVEYSWTNSNWAGIQYDYYIENLNIILIKAKSDFQVTSNGIVSTLEKDVEDFYSLLIEEEKPSDRAHGDIQVEKVVSTIQSIVTKESLTIEYGAAAGRFYKVFKDLKPHGDYLAIENDPETSLLELANSYGFQILTRDEFFRSNKSASLIVILNTLHHIPFWDLAFQLKEILAHLEKNGMLLLHDMGRLPQPEWGRVGWMIEDVKKLFDGPNFEIKEQQTITNKSQIPIFNALVKVVNKQEIGKKIEENVSAVWDQMESRLLDQIVIAKNERNTLELKRLQADFSSIHISKRKR